MIQTKCLRFCRLDNRDWMSSSSIAAATRRFWLATISAVMVGAHCDTTAFSRAPAGLANSASARARRAASCSCARFASAISWSLLAKCLALMRTSACSNGWSPALRKFAIAAFWASVAGSAAFSARLVAPRSRAHWPALSSSMSAVSLTEAASEAVARSKLAVRKTYPEMPIPKRASSATAVTSRLRILQTVPTCADALICRHFPTPMSRSELPESNLGRPLRHFQGDHRPVFDKSRARAPRRTSEEDSRRLTPRLYRRFRGWYAADFMLVLTAAR